MNCSRKILLLVFIFLFFKKTLYSQYILNGSAEKISCNCYSLTKEITTQSGSVWNSNKISLNNSFDFWFNVNLGCSDAGADGIVFILQPISTSVGSTGEGMGFAGVSPSIGIALDTYQNQNLNDPSFDHISIQSNGQINHATDLAGPIAISATSGNVEDCAWHKLRITWDAGTKWLRTYFDGVLRVEKQVDLVNSIFNNDPNVYWGFTGATGGAVNLQQFCTALDPIFNSNFTNNIACEGNPVIFNNTSESFAPIAGYNWSFGDGTFSTEQNPPPHIYPIPGNYTVNLKITGLDGCQRDSSKTITVAANPSASLIVFDTCFQKTPRAELVSQINGVNYQWTIDGTSTGTTQPMLDNLAAGVHRLQVVVSSNYNCGQAAQATADFIIKPLPQIQAQFVDGCVNQSISFDGVQTDAATSISQWTWNINNIITNSQNVQQGFNSAGDYEIKLWAWASNGCVSDTATQVITINNAIINANDTAIVANMPAQLQVTGNGSFLWFPSTGLSANNIANPIVTLNDQQRYVITLTTAEGCTAEDTMLVKVFKGPAIYVPTAFTPNGDGKNEILLPVYAGISELKEFIVFNRWGQQLFRTSNMQKGWEGRGASAGTYVWLIRALDYSGKAMLVKGTVTIIK